MIVIIDKANRRLFAHQLEQVSPLRPRDGALVFEGAWVGSLSGNAVNLAEDESVYIADLDRNHTVEAALRLTPARGASLLRDQFSRQFSPACAPEHSQIYEITHWISADLEAEGGGAAECYGELFSALLNHSRSEGLTHLNLFCDLELLPLLLDFGWSVIPLGLPVTDGGRDRLAVVVELSQK